MATKAETVNDAQWGKGCLGRSQDDEPVFVLVARDRMAPKTIRQWAENARGDGCTNEQKLQEAMRLATEMEVWQRKHFMKTPD